MQSIPMQASESSNNFQQQVLSELKQINQRLDCLESDVEKIDYKFDTHQEASDQVVRLVTTIVFAAASVVFFHQFYKQLFGFPDDGKSRMETR
ncbi:MAG: hypothetical protein F6K19_32810 [Cyanothece sp. SIO1E1]|nr:hypothetical protein [Cyanothece sp. SIO1E1]